MKRTKSPKKPKPFRICGTPVAEARATDGARVIDLSIDVFVQTGGVIECVRPSHDDLVGLHAWLGDAIAWAEAGEGKR